MSLRLFLDHDLIPFPSETTQAEINVGNAGLMEWWCRISHAVINTVRQTSLDDRGLY